MKKYADIWPSLAQAVGANGIRIIETPKYKREIAKTEERMIGTTGLFSEITYYNKSGEVVFESTAMPRDYEPKWPVIGEYVRIEANRQSQASQKYDAANTVQLKVKLNTKTDADIIEHLARKDNKSGYVKALIRKDMEEDGIRQEI